MPPALDVDTALAAIERGLAVPLDGRGDHLVYRVGAGIAQFTVKVGRLSRPGRLAILRRVDEALRAVEWYPRIVDAGFRDDALVVVRPFVEGRAFDYSPGDLEHLRDVMRELARLGRSAVVDPADLADYATPWITRGDDERHAAHGALVGERMDLATTVERRSGALAESAAAMSQETTFVYHGDLQGRNVVFARDRLAGVIDWDDAGFTRRPADAAKALWLVARTGRGDFTLEPHAVRRILALATTDLAVPRERLTDLARLGAVWFLPRQGHVAMLRSRDPALAEWYLGWVGRFWSRFDENMETVAAAAARLG